MRRNYYLKLWVFCSQEKWVREFMWWYVMYSMLFYRLIYPQVLEVCDVISTMIIGKFCIKAHCCGMHELCDQASLFTYCTEI